MSIKSNVAGNEKRDFKVNVRGLYHGGGPVFGPL